MHSIPVIHIQSGDVDGKDIGEFEQALLDPATAVLEAAAAAAILTAEEGTTHAARYTVVVMGGVRHNSVLHGLGMALSFALACLQKTTNLMRWYQSIDECPQLSHLCVKNPEGRLKPHSGQMVWPLLSTIISISLVHNVKSNFLSVVSNR